MLCRVRILFFTLSLFVSGCFATGEPEPVSLPVPFSGNFTADSRVVVANGNPVVGLAQLSTSKELKNLESGVSWNVFDSDGTQTGTVTYGSKSPGSLVTEGHITTFSVPVSFIFNDGCRVKTDNLMCFDFNYTVEAPDDPNILQTKGVCSGTVKFGTCSFTASVGKTMDHRYVYQFRLVNGERVFDKINLGSWIIQR